jgi:hypothetical protein
MQIERLVEMYLAAHWERLVSLLEVFEPEMRGQVGQLRGWLSSGDKTVTYGDELNRTDHLPPSEATEDLHKVLI